ncbi:RNA polymerase sigma-70 factor [Pedobacter hiemivivus]|uniref:RNA polymerase sigma-70 factor n=1 Tax=Pedobacter hiemivivus TaxID=2530454 RepID=A0A4R0NDL5_9SPHI|nr:RNA polymerase sigma-70 factor [Pedobacter hiemivivus]TCC97172.1 RNA polymerase sigma-70 factor [Pedobacter hiemivivus]
MSVKLLKTESEEILLQMIKKGDYLAFEELYSRHFQTVYAMAYNILRDPQQSKDIVQDIFVWFWEHREQWNLTSCRGYLLTAVKFKTANYFRENKVKEVFFAGLSKQQMASEDNSVLMEVRQLNDLILSLTTELPERCQEIFRLSRFNQLSNREIAVKLGITEKTVEAHITSALKKLKEKLGKGHIFLYFLI